MTWQRYKPVLSACQAAAVELMGGSTLRCQCNMSDTRGQHQAADRPQRSPVIRLSVAAGSSHPSCTLASFFFFFFFPLPHFIFDTSTKSGGVIIRREATILYSARKEKKKKQQTKKKDKVPPSSLKITAGSSNRKLVRFTSLQLTDASVDTRSASSLLDNPRQQRSSSSAASPRRFALNSEGVVLGKLIF